MCDLRRLETAPCVIPRGGEENLGGDVRLASQNPYLFMTKIFRDFIYSIYDLTKIRYPISDPNGCKTIPFGAANFHVAHIREYPPPPGIIKVNN